MGQRLSPTFWTQLEMIRPTLWLFRFIGRRRSSPYLRFRVRGQTGAQNDTQNAAVITTIIIIMSPPPIGGGIKQWCCLTSDVCRVHREYSWRPQLLEARRAGRRRAGVRRVWAGAGPQRAAYRGGGISWRPPAYSLLVELCETERRRIIIRVLIICNRTSLFPTSMSVYVHQHARQVIPTACHPLGKQAILSAWLTASGFGCQLNWTYGIQSSVIKAVVNKIFYPLQFVDLK